MQRKEFLKWSGLSVMSAISTGAFAQPKWLNTPKDPKLINWIRANDRRASAIVEDMNKSPKNAYARGLGHNATVLASAYVTPESAYFGQQDVAEKLTVITTYLLSLQSEDGTINSGNFESPPDTGFLVELLAATRIILKNQVNPSIQKANQDLDTFLKRTANALLTGGVHTPNHRWVICTALSKLYALYGDKRYLARIEEWMSEGIYMDADGHYPERSAGIYAVVENNSLLMMSRYLSRPKLLDYVRKNLRMTWYYLEPNGDVVTNDSRRQDQYMESKGYNYYLQYRFLAILDQNAEFAAIADQIAATQGFEENVMQRYYFYFLEHEAMQQEMPRPQLPSLSYEKLLPTTHLLRIRRNDITSTLFGGADWPIIIASGRSNSPDFFSYRKGKAVLESLRLSTSFFSMGYFYGKGLRKEGNSYVLHHKMQSPYYQPMPKGKIRADGDYTLEPSTDSRFWNKMQFRDRPQSNVKEEDITVTMTERNGEVELKINVDGAKNVPITLELCFRDGGTLEGVKDLGNDNYQFDGNEASYKMDGDTIQFGPGKWAHDKLTGLEGERYSTHFGSLRMKGMHVYITGMTPFLQTLYFR